MSLILVVDDHAATREPLAKLLRFQGYETAVAADGAEALEAVRERRPDLVLLDLLMPGMDGVTFLNEAARELGGADLPVIVMTGGRGARRAPERPDAGGGGRLEQGAFYGGRVAHDIRAHLAA